MTEEEKPKPKPRPKKKPTVDPELVEAIWAAGVISTSGSLKLVNAGKTRVVRYTITSSMLPGAMNRLAKFMGASLTQINSANISKQSYRVAVQGAALHSVMTRVWDYLTMERKQQYADERKNITTTTEGPNPYR